MSIEEIKKFVEQELEKFTQLEEEEFFNEGLMNSYIGRINQCNDILKFIAQKDK